MVRPHGIDIYGLDGEKIYAISHLIDNICVDSRVSTTVRIWAKDPYYVGFAKPILESLNAKIIYDNKGVENADK